MSVPFFNFITQTINCIPRTWTYTAELQEIRAKHRELTVFRGQLNNLKESVISRVADAERQGQVIAPDVSVWLKDVESSEEGRNEVLAQGTGLLNRSCLCALCPCGCWNSQMFLSQVATEITIITSLTSRRNFEVVTQNPPLSSTELQPEDRTVGLDSVFENAWSFVEEDVVGVMGLYGMGGVGKTTLLKKINNKFMLSSHGFDIVIWVVISKEVNLRGVQNQIGKSLGLSWQESENMTLCARDIYNRLRRKRFVVLLDDIWEQLDLPSIGIPHPKDPNLVGKSKVVFTTRLNAVCGLMEADKIIKVECLKPDQAWELFQEKLAQKSLLDSDPEIRMLAETAAKECGGLPLALIVIGRTMASKRTVGEWNDALTMLRKDTGGFSGMDDKVFSLLKFSYDSLPNDSIRSCFFFCSLYPEDHLIPIEPLVQQWIGMGYIDKFDRWQEAIDKGDGIIGILRNTCLLSDTVSGTVKMHDIIRDMAHWIACDCGRDRDKILVITGTHVREAPKNQKFVAAQTVSLMDTEITRIQEIPNCPNLSTFLCSGTSSPLNLHENFFFFMPALRFLDLSGNQNVTPKNMNPRGGLIPGSIGDLPRSIGELALLEYLDLSSRIFGNQLPVEMKKLVKLKYLFVEENNKIPLGVIKSLVNLRKLKLSFHSFGNGKDDDRLAGIQELECLPELTCLDIKIPSLKDLETFLTKAPLVRCTRSITIGDYHESQRNSTLSAAQFGIEDFQSLSSMFLSYLPQFVVSWDITGPGLTTLHRIEIDECDSMVSLKWLCLAPRLHVLKIVDCSRIKGIFLEEDSVTRDENAFSSLKSLYLQNLPCVESLFPYALLLRSLKEVTVFNCPQLRRLPLNSNSAKNTLQYIEGRSDWWNKLIWENHSVKSNFASFFRAPR